jgi:hypothetical protein
MHWTAAAARPRRVRVFEDEVSGISLGDGSYPRSWSIKHCEVRKLTFEEAMTWKFYGPSGVEIERVWWLATDRTARIYWPPPSSGTSVK